MLGQYDMQLPRLHYLILRLSIHFHSLQSVFSVRPANSIE
jgi:hypothetical protein